MCTCLLSDYTGRNKLESTYTSTRYITLFQSTLQFLYIPVGIYALVSALVCVYCTQCVIYLCLTFSVRSGQIRNVDSARVSMVGQVKLLHTNQTATSIIESQPAESEEANLVTNQDAILEEEEESGGATTSTATASHSSSTREFKNPSEAVRVLITISNIYLVQPV